MIARLPGQEDTGTADEAARRADGQPLTATRPTAWRAGVASALLAAAIVGWAAIPVGTGRAGTKIALIAAIATAVLSVGQLSLSGVRPLEPDVLSGLLTQFAERLLYFVRAAPWAEIMIVAVLALEALHPARPWHTALLGVALIAYLFAVHLAETRARLSVLAPQLPVLAAGVGLLALAVGAAAVPGLPHGSTSLLIRAVAITAAVIVAAMAVPGNDARR